MTRAFRRGDIVRCKDRRGLWRIDTLEPLALEEYFDEEEAAAMIAERGVVEHAYITTVSLNDLKLVKPFDGEYQPLRQPSKEEFDRIKIQERLTTAMDKFKPNFDLMARNFLQIQPLFYDEALIWWAWNFERTCWEIVDDIDILNLLKKRKAGDPDFPIFKKDHILTSLKMEARARRPKDMPLHWVQFRDIVLDTKTGATFPATHDWFCVNPIPWKIGKSDATPTMDKLFGEWVLKEQVTTLYEILAYNVLRDYPIHRVFCFLGTGRNGKSRFQAINTKFVGRENTCSSDLGDLASNRFAAFNLYRKLVCQMGETNFSAVDNTGMLKRLTGQDMISFEMKNKQPINDVSYAKILISTNSLPSSADTSEGYYRRWMIIEFPHNFPEGKDIVESIPDEEFENLAYKVTKLLPLLLDRGTFTGEGTIDERKERYLSASNPLSLFLEETCDRDPDGRVKYNELFDDYKRWLSAHKRRIVKRSEFKEALIQEGYDIDKQRPSPDQDQTWVVTGLRKKVGLEKFTVPQKSLDDGHNRQLGVMDPATISDASPAVLVSPDPFPIKQPMDIVAYLKAQPDCAASFDDLLGATGVDLRHKDKWLMVNLRALATRGDVMNSPADTWRAL